MNISIRGMACLLFVAAPLAAQDPVSRLGWLAGCWENRAATRITTEMWTPPAGGLMVGASRTVVNGVARAWEHSRLSAAGDTLVFTAIPSGQREAAFRSTSLTDSSFTVENPDHDFPTRIGYTRVSADSFVARVEGPRPDGTMGGFTAGYRRVSCRVG